MKTRRTSVIKNTLRSKNRGQREILIKPRRIRLILGVSKSKLFIAAKDMLTGPASDREDVVGTSTKGKNRNMGNSGFAGGQVGRLEAAMLTKFETLADALKLMHMQMRNRTEIKIDRSISIEYTQENVGKRGA